MYETPNALRTLWQSQTTARSAATLNVQKCKMRGTLVVQSPISSAVGWSGAAPAACTQSSHLMEGCITTATRPAASSQLQMREGAPQPLGLV